MVTFLAFAVPLGNGSHLTRGVALADKNKLCTEGKEGNLEGEIPPTVKRNGGHGVFRPPRAGGVVHLIILV